MLKLLSKEISILLFSIASIEFIMWKILFAVFSIKEVNLLSIIVIFVLSILPIIVVLIINVLLKKEIREYSKEIAVEISRVENHNKRESKFDNYKYFSEIKSAIAEKNEKEKEQIKELEERLKIREQELTRTKEESELMFESAQAAFVLNTAEDGKIRYVNPFAKNLLGYSKEESVYEKETADFYKYPEQREEVIAKLKENGEILNFEVDLLKKDGTVLKCLLSANVIRLREWDFYYSIIIDLSQQKYIERELEKEKRTAQNYLNIAGVMMLAIDKNGDIIMINNKGCQMIGYDSEKEVIGINWFNNFTMVEEREAVMKVFKGIVDGEQDTMEYYKNYIITKSGEKRLISWHNRIMKDIDGNFLYVLSSGEDITERESLQEKINKFFEVSVDMIAITKDNKFIQVSPSWEKQFGWTKEELMNKSIAQFIHKDDIEDLKETSRETVALNKNLVNFICRMGTKLGEYRWTEWNSYLDYDEKTIFSSVRDITQNKENEYKLKEAILKAEEADRMKSQFLANMSHEIRTPMTAIIGLSGLLLKEDLKEKQHDYMLKISIAAKHLLVIINDILDFSKIEAGKMVLEDNEFSLYDLVGFLQETFELKENEKGVKLYFNIDRRVPNIIVADQLRINQILINIIGNALKFTESGFVITSITVENREDEDIELKFTIKDTGIGIAKDRLERLFQPFQQEDSSTTRKYGGTGLGLTISKKIIEMMGGKIWADSEKNSGSTFYFTIKCKTGRNNRKNVNNVSVLKGLNIILMEDNPGESEVYNGMLEGFIENIFQIKSIEEMEKIIEERAENNEKPIDIIIADCKSGEERIFDSIDRIKHLYKGYDEIEIILLKSLDDKNIIDRINRDSYVKIIKKPVKVSEIHDAILSAKVLRNLKSVEKKEDYLKKINYTKTLENKKILIAEDQEVNRVVIKGILEESGAEMDFAVNGLEVLKFLQKNRYDLIMLDIQMPEMDGFDTIKAIREKEEYRELPVIAITAHAMKSEIEKCILMGMNDHVSKPIDNDDLFSKIFKWLNIKRNNKRKNRLDLSLDKKIIEIKGINSVKLLYRIGNNMNTYKDVINIFYKRFIDFEGRVSKLIDDKNIDSLYKEIHAIRGSSGNISAESLSETGKKIEREIRTGKINEENIWKLIEELKIILESINDSGLLVEEIEKNREKAKFDYRNSSEVLEWLRAVKDALERQDLGARKIFESKEEFINVEEFLDEFEIIKSSLKNLEFKNAVYYITVLEDKIGGTKNEE